MSATRADRHSDVGSVIRRKGHDPVTKPCDFARRQGRKSPLRNSSLLLRVAAWSGLAAPLAVPGPVVALQDSLGSPGPELVATETRPALRLGAVLPELSDLHPLQDSTDLQEWLSSWDMGAARGRPLRMVLYDRLTAAEPKPDGDAVSAAIEQIRSTLDDLDSLRTDLPLHLALPIGEAQRFLILAGSAQDQRQWSEASILALKAADALREISPKSVAWALVETAEAALSESKLPEGVTEEATVRAQRLIRWARSALFTNGHPRAIQRAYYACRLVGVILP